jgi:hypothetical protein
MISGRLKLRSDRVRDGGEVTLGQNVVHDIAVDISQSKIAARVAVCQPLVIEPQSVE